jgi:threonyl-tRNA synthetase
VFWHPKGSTIRRQIEDFWKNSHIENGYDIVYTPHIANLDLWKTSGHYDFYREGMFDQMDVENEQYQIKPMNCPFHCLMYKDDMRSYRDLPIRWAELGTVYRYVYTLYLYAIMPRAPINVTEHFLIISPSHSIHLIILGDTDTNALGLCMG